MDSSLYITFGIVSIAIIAIASAVGLRMRIVYLEEVLAASYQLAGALLNDDDDEIQRRMGVIEYNAACLLLMDVLAAPDGPEAAALLAMNPETDDYDQVLMSAKRVRATDEGSHYHGPYIPTQ